MCTLNALQWWVYSLAYPYGRAKTTAATHYHKSAKIWKISLLTSVGCYIHHQDQLTSVLGQRECGPRAQLSSIKLMDAPISSKALRVLEALCCC